MKVPVVAVTRPELSYTLCPIKKLARIFLSYLLQNLDDSDKSWNAIS